MKITPNLGPTTRALYVLVGMGFIALGVWAPHLPSPWSVVMGVLGGVVIIEGIVGF